MKYLLTIVLLSISSFSWAGAACDELREATKEFNGPQKDGYTTFRADVWGIEGSETACYINFTYTIDEVKFITNYADTFGWSKLRAANHLASQTYRNNVRSITKNFIDTFPTPAKANGVEWALINVYYRYSVGIIENDSMSFYFKNGEITKG